MTDTAEGLLKEFLVQMQHCHNAGLNITSHSTFGKIEERARKLLEISKEYYEGERTVKLPTKGCEHEPAWYAGPGPEPHLVLTGYKCSRCGAKLKAKWEVE